MAPCTPRTVAAQTKPTARPPPRRQPRQFPSGAPPEPVTPTDPHRVSRPKALFVTISEYPDSCKYPTLNTVRQDLCNLYGYLQNDKQYIDEDIHILCCRSSDDSMVPTKANILREIDWLVEGTGPGDFRLFYHAGHVEQRRTTSKTERDSMDEGSPSVALMPYPLPHASFAAIVTVDPEDSRYPRKNLVLDNELRVRLVNGMGGGSTLIAILEGCHSETLLDLDTTRVFSPTGRASFNDITNLSQLADTRRLKTEHILQRGRGSSAARRHSGPGMYDCTLTRETYGVMLRCTSPTRCRSISEYANVVSISACLDGQNSSTNDKTMVHFLIGLLRANVDRPLTPHMLQERLTNCLVAEKLDAVRREATLTPDIEAKIRRMQNPKITTLRGSTYLLDLPLIVPSACTKATSVLST